MTTTPPEPRTELTYLEFITWLAINRWPAYSYLGVRRWPKPHFTKAGPGRRHNGLQRSTGSKLWNKCPLKAPEWAPRVDRGFVVFDEASNIPEGTYEGLKL